MSGCCPKKPHGTNLFIYFSHFLSAWGDRMWSFGVGLFLIEINKQSLQLSAVYGLLMGASVLSFGSLVGDIVDRVPRLKAAKTALVLQNLFVLLCAVVVYLFLVYRDDVTSEGLWAIYTAYGLIIFLSILSRLTSIARKIAVENDWIVQMCGSDFDMLASMTAILRRIDLATQILAPIATGLIMDRIGVEYGALFIGGWNIFSVIWEYYLLWKVYNIVPSLKKKKDLRKIEGDATETTAEMDKLECANGVGDGATENDKETYTAVANGEITDANLKLLEDGEIPDSNTQASNKLDIDTAEKVDVKQSRRCPACCGKLGFLQSLYRGWPVYVGYSILPSGLSLACLYMTVLGFDAITIGYIKMQGLSESLVGLAMGVSAAFGIFGTMMYPLMRKRLGLVRTGIFGLSTEILSLAFCVASVWVPGSPFDLSLGMRPPSHNYLTNNCTISEDAIFSANVSVPSTYNTTASNMTIPHELNCLDILEAREPTVSLWMFLGGIITARFGLWVADLSISQIYFETVAEKDRGKVGGVQTALNQFMDMLKFGLVVLLPFEHQFGLLVLISFCFIVLAWLLYAIFLHKNRGHFFHLDKCISGCKKAEAAEQNTADQVLPRSI